MIPSCNFTLLTHNRYNLTKQCLESLARGGSLLGLKITIIDDRSDDETRHLIKTYAPWFGAHVVFNDEPSNIGANRNRVIAESEKKWGRQQYLYISDNDVYFHRGWYKQLVKCFDKASAHGYAAVGAYNHPFHRYGEEIKCGDHSVMEVQALSHQSLLMRWDTWDECGPCIQTPEELACQSEDMVFSKKIQAAGYKLGTVFPPLAVNTGITNSYGQEIVGADLVRQEARKYPEVVLE